jgi:hypothetical protein
MSRSGRPRAGGSVGNDGSQPPGPRCHMNPRRSLGGELLSCAHQAVACQEPDAPSRLAGGSGRPTRCFATASDSFDRNETARAPARERRGRQRRGAHEHTAGGRRARISTHERRLGPAATGLVWRGRAPMRPPDFCGEAALRCGPVPSGEAALRCGRCRVARARSYAGRSPLAGPPDSTSVVGAPWIAGTVPSRPAW